MRPDRCGAMDPGKPISGPVRGDGPGCERPLRWRVARGRSAFRRRFTPGVPLLESARWSRSGPHSRAILEPRSGSRAAGDRPPTRVSMAGPGSVRRLSTTGPRGVRRSARAGVLTVPVRGNWGLRPVNQRLEEWDKDLTLVRAAARKVGVAELSLLHRLGVARRNGHSGLRSDSFLAFPNRPLKRGSDPLAEDPPNGQSGAGVAKYDPYPVHESA
jgi:hypothetical protein